MYREKIISVDDLQDKLINIRNLNKKIVLCHGVFDLCHPGHIQHFLASKKLADILIISVTSDRYVNKGPGRPLFNERIRSEFISQIECVDFVVISDNPNAVKMINLIKPNIYSKGADYKNMKDDLTGMILKEKEAVEKIGGEICFTNEITFSSSALINSHLSILTNESKAWINEFKLENGYEQCIKWLDKIKKLNVLILGETIIDKYTFCNPLAKSSKDPILAFQVQDSHVYPGGVLPIAINCSLWAKNVNVISFRHHNDSEIEIFGNLVNSGLSLKFLELIDRPTILKHRFVDINSNSRVFEYYDFNQNDLSKVSTLELINLIFDAIPGHDVVIAADYGHGYFTSEVIKSLESISSFLAVNTQSNAGNRGFNSISKYKKLDFLSLNSAELQFELRDRNPNFYTIVPELIKIKQASYAILTLGGEGLIVFDNKNNFEKVPAFASKIIDKVGAGDSVLSIASLLASIGAPLKVIGFISNIVAAHEVSQLGHKNSLTINDIVKHAKSLLL